MNNPFKAGDVVTTKVKGQPIEATVNQVWNQEVQVRTTDKKLLWRTVKTVTLVNAAPLAEPKPEAGAAESAASTGSSEPTPEPEASTLPKTSPSKPYQPAKDKRKPKVKTGPSLAYERVRPRNRKRPKI